MTFLKKLTPSNLSTIFLIISVIPVFLNWGLMFVVSIFYGDTWSGSSFPNKFVFSPIVSGFWTQAVWTALFFGLSIFFSIKAKKKKFSKWVSIGLVIFLLFLTLSGIIA